jgi:uracil-DNA glycosylase
MIFEYSAGVFVYRIERGRTLVLLLKRVKDYDVPKGHIEKGEHAADAAHRELKEETGLSVSFVPHFLAETRYFFSRGGEKVLKRDKFFLGRARTERVRISEEHIGYEWLDYDGFVERIKYKDLERVAPRVFDYIGRYERMKRLNSEYAKLPFRARGWKLSRRLVPGDGPLDAEVMLVGEAPGATEDALGKPFVGRSGRKLDALLKKAGLGREDCYITSMAQFRPPGNRAPTRGELAECRSFLDAQIGIVKPKTIILLGRTAAASVLGIDKIAAGRGRAFDRGGATYFVTYHPAAALRSTTNAAFLERDLRRIKAMIGAASSRRAPPRTS